MKRVLITGADGFTGRYLAPLLTAGGYTVHGMAPHLPTAPVEGVAQMHVVDLTDAASLVAAVGAARPEYVVHLGGISFVVGDAEPMYQVNLLGTRKLLEALAALPEAPRAVLLASSANVYGNSTEGVLDETTPPAPANDYAVSKLAMEHVARLYAARLPLIVCRPFNYTGVGQAESFLLPKIVAHVRRRAPSIELGNLDVARDFSDVRDVASIYAQLLEEPKAAGKTLNVCSGRAFTLREVLAMTEEVSGWPMELRVNADLMRSNEVKILLGSRARLDALLSTKRQGIPLRDTLRWMIEAPLAPEDPHRAVSHP
jgi:nucleoside-diphosphate-sugar epimerase